MWPRHRDASLWAVGSAAAAPGVNLGFHRRQNKRGEDRSRQFHLRRGERLPTDTDFAKWRRKGINWKAEEDAMPAGDLILRSHRTQQLNLNFISPWMILHVLTFSMQFVLAYFLVADFALWINGVRAETVWNSRPVAFTTTARIVLCCQANNISPQQRKKLKYWANCESRCLQAMIFPTLLNLFHSGLRGTPSLKVAQKSVGGTRQRAEEALFGNIFQTGS